MTRRIASIYFAEVKATRPLYGGYYRIPAVSKGGDPVFLTVNDLVQRSQEPSADGKTRVTNRYLVDGKEIVSDIVREWTRDAFGMNPQCCPGIWIVREEIPLVNADGLPLLDDGKTMWRPASEDEKEQMWQEDLANARRTQDAWADYLIRQGDVLAEDPKQWVMISDLMRIACRHYGRERDWLQELRDGDIKKCPACTKSISPTAMVCPECRSVVDFARYARYLAQQEAAIEAAKKELAGEPAAPLPPPIVVDKPKHQQRV